MNTEGLVRLMGIAVLVSGGLLPVWAEAGGCRDASQSEIKIVIEPGKIDAALRALGLEHEKPRKERTVFFFDTCTQELGKKGIILRARKVEGGGDKTTAKRRPMDPAKVPEAICADVKCEEDRSSESAKVSCSLDRDVSGHQIEDASEGKAKVAKLFSSDQLELVGLGEKASLWDQVRVLGPIRSRAWEKEIRLGSADATLAVEEWTLPDAPQSRVLEVSQRVDRSRATRALGSLTAGLKEQGIEPAKQQGEKTAKALAAIARSRSICPADRR